MAPPIDIENVVIEDASIIGSITWGHDTGVVEDHIRDLSLWNGTGSVQGSGDSEELLISAGQYMESPNWQLGAGSNARIRLNVYASGDDVTIKYRTSATEGGLSGEAWSTYSAPFTSLGWVQIRLEA